MRKLHIFLAVLPAISCPNIFWGQNYTVTHPANEELKKQVLELAKEMFEPEFTLEYSFTSYDLYSSLDSVPAGIDYSTTYRQEQEERLKANPTDAFAWNNLGNYYGSVNNPDEAIANYLKAFQHLDATISKDSALYYSFRGSLKMNLEMEGSLTDFEQAISMDADDSIAVYFLPLSLLNSGQFEKGKSYCEEQMGRSSGMTQSIWFMFFSMSDLMGQIGELMSSEENLQRLRKTDYDKVFDLSRIEAAYRKYGNNPQIVTARGMLDIFPLLVKMITSMDGTKSIQVSYTKLEKQRIADLKNQFGVGSKPAVNEFSRLKTLAFLLLLQGDAEAAKQTFGEAIALFPMEKQSGNFNRKVCYGALLSINWIEKNTKKNIALLEKLVNTAREYEVDPTWTTNLAKYYLKENDYENFRKNAVKAYTDSKYNYEALRLMGHLAFIDNDAQIDYYLNKAGEKISESQYVDLALQFALYFIARGNGNNAHRFIQQARDMDPGSPCELCDKLEKKYLKVE